MYVFFCINPETEHYTGNVYFLSLRSENITFSSCGSMKANISHAHIHKHTPSVNIVKSAPHLQLHNRKSDSQHHMRRKTSHQTTFRAGGRAFPFGESSNQGSQTIKT